MLSAGYVPSLMACIHKLSTYFNVQVQSFTASFCTLRQLQIA